MSFSQGKNWLSTRSSEAVIIQKFPGWGLDADFYVACNVERVIILVEGETLEFEVNSVAGTAISIDWIESNSGRGSAVIGVDIMRDASMFCVVPGGAFDELGFCLQRYFDWCLPGIRSDMGWGRGQTRLFHRAFHLNILINNWLKNFVGLQLMIVFIINLSVLFMINQLVVWSRKCWKISPVTILIEK